MASWKTSRLATEEVTPRGEGSRPVRVRDDAHGVAFLRPLEVVRARDEIEDLVAVARDQRATLSWARLNDKADHLNAEAEEVLQYHWSSDE
jgi:hypothetical protein